jgi:tetratricopeptide (TPR) repeat protein
MKDQALVEAQRAIGLDRNSASGYFALAEILNTQDRSAEALAVVEKAMRLDPRNSVNYSWHQGWALSELGRWEEAIAALKSYLARYPDFIWAHMWLAIDYFHLRDDDGARAETAQVERIAALNKSAAGYAALAISLNMQRRPAEALVAAERGMPFDPNNPFIAYHQGWAFDQLGRWEQALAAWKRYLVLYPDDIGARAFLAGEYSALGQMDAARRETAQIGLAVAIGPDSAYGHRFLAMAMNATGRPAEALAAAESAIRLNPSSGPLPPYPLCEQGRAYTQLGRWEEAVRSLNACLKRHPDQVGPHVDLAVDYVELGQEDAAQAEVAEIPRLNPQFSLKMALESEFPAQREHVVADLRKAGLN